MKKIFIILLMVVLSLNIFSCSVKQENQAESGTVQESKQSVEITKESKDNEESISEEESTDSKDEDEILTITYAARIRTYGGSIMRKILLYEYRNDNVLKLTEYSGIRYKPLGEEAEEEDKESIKEAFGRIAERINQIDGIDVVTDAKDEEYTQTVVYDYTKINFEEYNKLREELGWEDSNQSKNFKIMSQVSKDLKAKGYFEIKESDFKGVGSKSYSLDQDDGDMVYTMEYEDNAIKRFSFSINASYDVLGIASKEEAEEKCYLKKENADNGATYNFEFRDDCIVVKASFDLVNGSCEEFRKNDSNFIFKSADELYMTHIVPEVITQGFIEEESKFDDIA